MIANISDETFRVVEAFLIGLVLSASIQDNVVICEIGISSSYCRRAKVLGYIVVIGCTRCNR